MVGQLLAKSKTLPLAYIYSIPYTFYCIEMSRKKNIVKGKTLFVTKGLQLLVKASCYQVLELLTLVAPVVNEFTPYFFPQF